MHSRFVMEGKPGVTSRSGATYSDVVEWRSPHPVRTSIIRLVCSRKLSAIRHPSIFRLCPTKRCRKRICRYPLIRSRQWHFRQSIEYSITANRAGARLCFTEQGSGCCSILIAWAWTRFQRGGRDTWTITPRRVQAAKTFDDLRSPALRDPRGYVIPARPTGLPYGQRSLSIALIKNGVSVLRAAVAVRSRGKDLSRHGSFVVKNRAGIFGRRSWTMFEPQDHPDDFAYPGAPPTPAVRHRGMDARVSQMRLWKFDRLLDGFDGPFEKLTGESEACRRSITDLANPVGYFAQAMQVNDSFIAVNRPAGSKEDV